MREIVSTLITAFSIMLGGIAVMMISLSLLGASFESLTQKEVGELKTDTVAEGVTSLAVDVWDVNVEILPSEDGKITVSRNETEKVFYSVSVENGTLTVRRVDNRKWYERIQFFNFNAPVLTVRLPKGEYQTLNAKVRSFNLSVAEGIVFDRATVTASSGSVRYFADVKETLTLTVTSGSLSVKKVSAGEITGTVTSGRMKWEEISCKRLTLSGTSGTTELNDVAASDSVCLELVSGSVTLTDVVCDGDFSVKSTSGSLRLNRCDGEKITLQTTSGSVKGTLRSPKVFNVKVSSGSVNVPDSVQNAGLCEIKTTSGSVKISIEE